MNPWAFLLLWIGSYALHLAVGVYAYSKERTTGDRRLGPLVVSGVASIPPLITLLLFVRVFVLGGSSNVAQLAGEDGYDLWRLWFQAWPLLFFGNPAAFLVTLGAAFLPPYPPRHWASFVSRLSAVSAAACAWYVVVKFFPDA